MNKSFRILAFILAAVMAMSAFSFSAFAAEFDEADVAEDIAVTETGEPEPELKTAEITDVTNTASGSIISWKAVDGASKYALYTHKGDEYKLLGETGDLNIAFGPLENLKEYVFAVRAMDADGNFITDYSADYSNIFYAPPVITSLTAEANGLKLVWGGYEGVEAYRVYRKVGSSGWSRLALVNGTEYLDTTAESGKMYTYTVRCTTSDGETFLSHHNSGVSYSFVKTPVITSFSNTLTGTRVYFDKPEGVSKIRVYYRGENGWNRIGETSDTSIVHDKLVGGTTYTYTVRGVDSNGDFVTDFNTDGWENMFIDAPVITSLDNVPEGVKINWNPCAGAVNYRVYYYGSKGWTKLTETKETSFVDTDVRSGYHYTYTVRCITEDGTGFTSYHNSGKKSMFVSVPQITSFSNTATGTRISWEIPDGADAIRLYMKSDTGWKRLTETTSTNVLHQSLTPGKQYVYTVRCVDSNGDFLNDFNHDGWTNTFIEPPVITSLDNVVGGVMINWNPCEGAEKYRIYYYGSKGWTKMAETTETSFLDTDVRSGNHYTYTVRCISADGSTFTSYHNSGKKVQYVAAPEFSSITNTEDGVLLKWDAVNGADFYRIYYKNEGGGWTRLASKYLTEYLDTSVKNGETRIYTIRSLQEPDTFVSDFNHDGWKNTFFAPPVIKSVAGEGSGYRVSWDAVSGVAGYRLYRKEFGGSWARLFDSTPETSYLDNTAVMSKVYSYTLRCVDASGETVSDFISNNPYYYNGKLADGNINVNGTSFYFDKGYLRAGFQKINGKTYYYSKNGVLMKDGIVGSDADGYAYADKNGVVDFNYRGAVTTNGVDWIVEDGKAYKVADDDDRMLFRAMKLVAKVTNSSMSKSEKLRACFDYLQNNDDYTEMNPRIPDYTGMDWMIVYANDIFVDDRGNCLSYAAAFAYMAKAIGYKNVYGCNSGGHGWAEIEGLIYDPEWGMHNFNYSYYGMSYDEPCDVAYAVGISAGEPFMHIKIS